MHAISGGRTATSSQPKWTLHIYTVADQSAQQRVLVALRQMPSTGITALGTGRVGEHLVIVDCLDDTARARAMSAIRSADPTAFFSYRSRQRADRVSADGKANIGAARYCDSAASAEDT